MNTLPTISVGDYAREEMAKTKPMETVSSNYSRLQEEELQL